MENNELDKDKIGTNPIKANSRAKNNNFCIGNKLGTLAKGVSKNPELAELNAAIATVEKERKISLMKHFIERALLNDIVLVALMKKKVADMTKAEVNNTLDNYREILAEAIRIRESINGTVKK